MPPAKRCAGQCLAANCLDSSQPRPTARKASLTRNVSVTGLPIDASRQNPRTRNHSRLAIWSVSARCKKPSRTGKMSCSTMSQPE